MSMGLRSVFDESTLVPNGKSNSLCTWRVGGT